MVKNIPTILSFFFAIVLAASALNSSVISNGKSDKPQENPMETFFQRIVRGHLWFTFESDMPLVRINPIKTKINKPNKFVEKFANFFLKDNKIKHL
jgi:hypothetical protein